MLVKRDKRNLQYNSVQDFEKGAVLKMFCKALVRLHHVCIILVNILPKDEFKLTQASRNQKIEYFFSEENRFELTNTKPKGY